MRLLSALLLMTTAFAATAEDYLYVNDEAGIKIGKSQEVASIAADGNYLSFEERTNRYMITALVLEQRLNDSYPMPEKMNELLFSSTKKRYPDLHLEDKSKISIAFKNRSILGSSYLSGYSGSSNELCDVNIIHPVGNNHYFVFTLTTLWQECKNNYDSLMNDVRSIYKTIQVDDV